MAGDNIHNAEYSCDTFSDQRLLGRKQEFVRNLQASTSSPYLEMIDGVLYRKKSEKGNTNYREILDEGRRLSAIATFHLKGKTHRTLEETYRFVAENYWWEGMYFHIREYVLGCQKCHAQRRGQDGPGPLVSRTLASHSNSVLRELRSQREAGLFCDVILKTGSRSLPAHRAVLAAVSEYFQEIFTETGCAPGLQAHVDLSGFSEEFFLPLLEFCYSSTLSVQAGLLGEVCALAQHLRIGQL
ncbi:hypothetical protein GJAV_G00254150 [Gymnothorax javanicus]|nr:hypothetical protein GJAV_G00254150 [Gymnothorax javanicus]